MSRLFGLALVLSIACAGVGFADGDDDATEVEVADSKRILVFKKGPDGEIDETTGRVKVELDATDLSVKEIERWTKKLTADGFRLVEERRLTADADGEVESEIRRVARKASVVDGALRRDLRELIRRGGKLPEGYRPKGAPDVTMPGWWRHGDGPPPQPPTPSQGVRLPGASTDLAPGTHARQVSARIIERYLEVKDDETRASAFESALAVVARHLKRGDGSAHALGIELLPAIAAGLQREEQAAGWIELMELLQSSFTAPDVEPRLARRLPAPPPPVAPPSPRVRVRSDRLEFGGARLVAGGLARETGVSYPDLYGLRVLDVAEGSVAAEMSLREGDLIREIDGQGLVPGGSRRFLLGQVRKVQRLIENGGQLTLRVRRKGGETETLEIEFERE